MLYDECQASEPTFDSGAQPQFGKKLGCQRRPRINEQMDEQLELGESFECGDEQFADRGDRQFADRGDEQCSDQRDGQRSDRSDGQFIDRRDGYFKDGDTRSPTEMDGVKGGERCGTTTPSVAPWGENI